MPLPLILPDSLDSNWLPDLPRLEALSTVLARFSNSRQQKGFSQCSNSAQSAKNSSFLGCTLLLLLDGSVNPLTQAMGIGIVATDPDDLEAVIKTYALCPSDPTGEPYRGTSPVAELVGLCLAIRLAVGVCESDPKAVIGIGTDSENSVKWFEGSFTMRETHIQELVVLARQWAEALVQEQRIRIRKAARDLTSPADGLAREAAGLKERPDESSEMTLEEFDLARKQGRIASEARVRVLNVRTP